MELINQILAAFAGIPPAAIIIFLIVSVVIAIELWRLRPQRQRPPIPLPPDATLQQEASPGAPQPTSPTQPVIQSIPPTEPGGFRPLTTQQIVILIVLLTITVLIPTAVLLYKKTKSPIPTPSSTTSPPPVTPSTRITPEPTLTPRLTPQPPSSPGGATASPIPTSTMPTESLPPTKVPVMPTSTPTISPIPTTASPSGLPRLKKPGELPGAGTSLVLVSALAGGGLVALGLRTLRKSPSN